MSAPPPIPPTVNAAYATLPTLARGLLLDLRAQLFALATADPRIGPLTESLKWGQPSYVPSTARIGTPIRLWVTKDGLPSLFTHCQSGVIPQMAPLAPPDFAIDGSRGIAVPLSTPADHPFLLDTLRAALTYRL